ncbi:ABC transporter permease [Kineococcus aurantiacus]|uniref:ABC transporter permease n=1 Tax=Kineococcus aurantiacus TaxID=37633 RepID=UPI0031D278DA
MSNDSLTRTTGPETTSPSGAAPARRLRLQFTTVAAARSIVPLLVVVVVLAWVTGSQNPAFLTPVNAQNVLTQVAVLGILAVGQTFLVVGGQIDLSVGSLVSLVGVVAARCFADGWSTPSVVVLTLAIGAATGLVWGVAVAYLDVPPFILTLGASACWAPSRSSCRTTPRSPSATGSPVGASGPSGLCAPLWRCCSWS